MKKYRPLNFFQQTIVWIQIALIVSPTSCLTSWAQPVVTQVRINHGDVSRSVVTNLAVTFNTNVAIASPNLLLQNLTTGTNLPSTNLALSYNSLTREATWTFPGLAGGSLPPGNWLAGLPSPAVTDTNGNALIGVPGGTPGDPLAFQFYRYSGDVNGDRDVDFADTYWFKSTWLRASNQIGFDPRFDFSGDGIVNSNDLPLFQSNYFTIFPPQPGIFAALANDTGTSATDSITSDPTISGTVFRTNNSASFRAALTTNISVVPTNFMIVTSDLTINGNFRFSSNRLAQIKGGPLLFGTNVLVLRTVETNGNISSTFRLSFVLEEGECFFPNGIGWIVSVAPAANLGSVIFANCEAVMTEGESFTVTLEKSFAIPPTPGLLTIQYSAPTFDSSATNLMRDAFEAALVDASGRPLTFTIQGSASVTPANVDTPSTLPANPAALFNHSDGKSPFAAPGTAFQPSLTPQLSTIFADVSHLAPNSSARLILRLVNNDRDRHTTIRITDVRLKVADPSLNLNGSPSTAFSLLGGGSGVAALSNSTNSDCPPGADGPRAAGLVASVANYPTNFFASNVPVPEITNIDTVLPANGRLIFSSTADLQQGTLFNVTAAVVPGELQLVGQPSTFPFIWIANHGEGTVSKFSTRTGRELGRYRTGPESLAPRLNPSRTSVDADGNAWVANRMADVTDRPGSVIKVLQTDFIDRNGNGQLDSSEDRNGNGRIDSDEIVPWDANSDGQPDDERIALSVQVGRSRNFPNNLVNNGFARAAAVDGDNNLWIGLWNLSQYEVYRGSDGAFLAIVPTPNSRPYGAALGHNGQLWGTGRDANQIHHIDIATRRFVEGIPIDNPYGITVDPDGVIWQSQWQSLLVRYDPSTRSINRYGVPSGENELRGIAVDRSRNVWVASTSHDRLIKFMFDSTHINLTNRLIVAVGGGPAATVMDSDGFIWTTTINDDRAWKIDPTNNVVITNLVTGREPYTYSDMTGQVLIESARRGTWTEIVDSGRSGTVWGTVDLTRNTPTATFVGLKVRASDARGTLPSLPEIEVVPGQSLPYSLGRYLEIKVTLGTDVTNTTPTVQDITVLAVPPPALVTDAPGTVFAPGATILLSGQATAAQPSAPGGSVVGNSITHVTLNGASVEALDPAGNYYSAVQIRPGLNTVAVTATDFFGQTTTNTLILQGACPNNSSTLQVVSASVQPEYGRTSFNEWTTTLYADLALRNGGTYPVRAPFYVGVTHISDPTVRLLAADGVTADGISYYDFSTTLTNGTLARQQTSLSRTLAFHNPNKVQFTYELVVLGQLNQAPYFTSIPRLEAIVGKPYTYPFAAIDPDGDALAYSLITGPTDMVLNASTLTFQPPTNQLGTHDIRLRADDGKGGIAEQHYLLSVINPPSNRPPYFVSTPVTVAHVFAGETVRASSSIFLTGHDPDFHATLGRNTPGARKLNTTAINFITDSNFNRFTAAGIRKFLFVESKDSVPSGHTRGVNGIIASGYQLGVDFDHHDYTTLSNALEQLGTSYSALVVASDFGGLLRQEELDILNARSSDIIEFLNQGGGLYAIAESNNGQHLTPRGGQFQFLPFVVTSTPLDQTEAGNSVSAFGAALGLSDSDVNGNASHNVFDATLGLNIVNVDAQGRILSLAGRGTVLPTGVIRPGEYVYEADAADPDNDQLTYSLLAAPTNMVINPRTGLIVWPPNAEQIGLHNLTVLVTDGRGGSNTQAYVICVLPVEGNRAPIIITVPLESAIHGGTYCYDVDALDPDSDTISYSLKQAPPGMTINSTTGLISWNTSQAGSNGFAPGLQTFSGEDLNFSDDPRTPIDDAVRLPMIPNAAAARDGFVGRLRNVLGQSFEGFLDGFSPTNLVVGSELIRVSGAPTIKSLPETTYNGAYPISGTNLLHNSGPTGTFGFDFSTPQSAFGFFAVDLGDGGAQLSVTIFRADGTVTNLLVAHSRGSTISGSVFFFGVIDVTNPFTGIRLNFPPASTDSFGLDDMIIGRPEQVMPPSVVVVVRASDSRGGVDEQAFSITAPYLVSGGIRGEVFAGDANTSVQMPTNHFGSSNVVVFIDLNENNIQDSCEPFAISDTNGLYQILGLNPGCYLLGVTPPEGWRWLNVKTNLAFNGSFERLRGSFDALMAPLDPSRPNWLGVVTISNGWTDLPGWHVDSQESLLAVERNSYDEQFFPSEGDLELVFNGGNTSPGAVLSQVLCTETRHNYHVSFAIARDGFGLGVMALTVSAVDSSGLVIASMRSMPDGVGWKLQGLDFIATSPTTTLIFKDTSEATASVDIYLDDVVVSDGRHLPYTVYVPAGVVHDAVDFQMVATTTDGSPPQLKFTTEPASSAPAQSNYLYRAFASGNSDASLQFDLVVRPEGMLVETNTGIVAWRPLLSQLGVHDVILRVQDGCGGVALQSFQVTVIAPNTPPIITSFPPNPAVRNLPYRYIVRAQDAEGQTLTFSLGSNAPAGMSLNSQPSTLNSAVLDWTPALTNIGTNRIEIVVRDSEGAESRQVFDLDVVVSAPNHAPVFTTSPRTQTRIGFPYVYLAEATDVDGDPLAFSLVSGPAGMSLTNSQPSTFNSKLLLWTPNDLGQFPVSLAVSDGRPGGIVTQQFVLNVTSTLSNSAPQITSSPSLNATDGQTYEYDAIATDPDSDPVTWNLVSGPVGMSIDSASGKVLWIPTLDQLGTNNVIIEARDIFSASTTQSFNIDVGCVNRPPQISSVPPVEAHTDTLYLYAPRATDPDGDKLSWNFASPAPSGMTINSTNGLIRWTPTTNQVGAQFIRVRVSDGRGGSDTQNYTLYVANSKANKAPVILSSPFLGATVNRPYTYTLRATDADGDALTLQSLVLPTGATLTPTTSSAGLAEAVVRWTPTFSQLGANEFILVAKDPAGSSAAQRFIITVRANQPPQIVSTPRTNGIPNVIYRYDVSAFDPENDALSYAVSQAPRGMTIDALGRIAWTPNLTQLGLNPVTVTVSDGFGGLARQSYAVNVGADTELPMVTLFVRSTLFDPQGHPAADVNTTVPVGVRATDNVGVTSLALYANGNVVPLVTDGTGLLPVAAVGVVNFTAIATDAAGNTGTATNQLYVVNRNDPNFPTITILDPKNSANVTALTPVIATIANSSPLVSYEVSFAKLTSDTAGVEVDLSDPGLFFQAITNVTLPARTFGITNATLCRFDPTILLNDSYVIRVAATDINRHMSTEGVVVNLSGNLKFGEFRLEFTDLAIPVAGIPITFRRIYDSRDSRRIGDFGYGWSLGLADARILKTGRYFGRGLFGDEAALSTKSRVYLTNPDGRRVGFTFEPYVADGSLVFGAVYKSRFKSDPGVYDTLSALDNADYNLHVDSDGSIGLSGFNFLSYDPSAFRLTTKEGLKYDYNQSFGLQKVTDLNGNTLTFTRDGIFHRLAGSSAIDQQVTFVRDSMGRITQVIDPTGNPLKYGYDGGGDLRTFTDQGTNLTRYAYHTARAHYLTNIIDPLGNSAVQAEYDDGGRFIGIKNANRNNALQDFDSAQNIGTFTDANGNVTTLYYDTLGNLIKVISPENTTTEFQFSDAKNPTKATGIIYPNGETARFAYDFSGNYVTVTDPAGKVTQLTRDSRGAILEIRDPAGQSWRYRYDERAKQTTKVNPEGGTDRYSYDHFGNRTNHVDVYGNTNTFAYTPAGLLARRLTPQGRVTEYEYDAFGQKTLLRRLFKGTDGSTRSAEEHFRYDRTGQLIETLDPTGYRISSVYDAAGRLTKQTDTLGRTNELRYDAEGNRTVQLFDDGTEARFQFDAMNRTVFQTDRYGREATTSYDKLGRITSETKVDGTRVAHIYDANGFEKENVVNDGTNHFHYSPQWSFDRQAILENGPLDSKNPAAIENSTGERADFVLDSNGRVAQISNGVNSAITVLQDSFNFPSSVNVPGQKPLGVSTDVGGRIEKIDAKVIGALAYTYTSDGQLKSVSDANGHITEVDYNHLGQRTTKKDSNGHVTRWNYDDQGRLISRILPAGNTDRFWYQGGSLVATNISAAGQTNVTEYDEFWRLRALSVNGVLAKQFTYDLKGRITSVTNRSGAFGYEYDAKGKLSAMTYPGGLRVTYHYDEFGRKTNVTSRSVSLGIRYAPSGTLSALHDNYGNGVTFDSVTRSNQMAIRSGNGILALRTYDALNNLISIAVTRSNDAIVGMRTFNFSPEGHLTNINDNSTGDVRYGYDDAGRLTSQKSASLGLDEEYFLDPVGNRVSEIISGIRQNSAYGPNDEILARGIAKFRFGGNGEMLERTESSNTWQYSFDDENRLSEVRTPEAKIIRYAYDPDGNLFSRSINGVIDYYVADIEGGRGVVIAKYSANGNLASLWGRTGNALFWERTSSRTNYCHSDEMASAWLFTDQSGNLSQNIYYDAFGRKLQPDGPGELSPAFNGSLYDAAAQIYLMGARAYQPELGRFLTRDTEEGTEQVPFTGHPYIYAAANPVAFKDPSGRSVFGEYALEADNARRIWGAVINGIATMIAVPMYTYTVLNAEQRIKEAQKSGKLEGAFHTVGFSSGFGNAFGSISDGASHDTILTPFYLQTYFSRRLNFTVGYFPAGAADPLAGSFSFSGSSALGIAYNANNPDDYNGIGYGAETQAGIWLSGLGVSSRDSDQAIITRYFGQAYPIGYAITWYLGFASPVIGDKFPWAP